MSYKFLNFTPDSMRVYFLGESFKLNKKRRVKLGEELLAFLCPIIVKPNRT